MNSTPKPRRIWRIIWWGCPCLVRMYRAKYCICIYPFHNKWWHQFWWETQKISNCLFNSSVESCEMPKYAIQGSKNWCMCWSLAQGNFAHTSNNTLSLSTPIIPEVSFFLQIRPVRKDASMVYKVMRLRPQVRTTNNNQSSSLVRLSHRALF